MHHSTEEWRQLTTDCIFQVVQEERVYVLSLIQRNDRCLLWGPDNRPDLVVVHCYLGQNSSCVPRMCTVRCQSNVMKIEFPYQFPNFRRNSSTFYKLFNYFVFICMGLLPSHSLYFMYVPMEPRRGYQIIWDWNHTQMVVESPYEGWNLSLRSLQERPVLLVTETAVQPRTSSSPYKWPSWCLCSSL